MTQPRMILGFLLIAAALLVAIFAPFIAPHDPLASGVDMLTGPTQDHWLGTDEIGRDVFSRLIFGARTSLAIGVLAASLALALGSVIGLVAGYFRGWVDSAIVPIIDLFIALPALVLALIITVVVGASLTTLVVVLGFVMWPPIARLVRGQVFAIREQTFIEAAQALGGSSAWIIRRHVLPNVTRLIGSQFAITVSFAIFTSASLSFLGLGVPPPTPDWGGLVRSGFDFLSLSPWMSLGPGAAVTFTALGFYFVGSSLR